MIDTSDIGAFLGLDVGEGEHHATAVTPVGKKAFDKRLPNSEPELREAFGKLQAQHGTVLVIVDQPASIGALPITVDRDMGCQVAYLPGRRPRSADVRQSAERPNGFAGRWRRYRCTQEVPTRTAVAARVL